MKLCRDITFRCEYIDKFAFLDDYYIKMLVSSKVTGTNAVKVIYDGTNCQGVKPVVNGQVFMNERCFNQLVKYTNANRDLINVKYDEDSRFSSTEDYKSEFSSFDPKFPNRNRQLFSDGMIASRSLSTFAQHPNGEFFESIRLDKVVNISKNRSTKKIKARRLRVKTTDDIIRLLTYFDLHYLTELSISELERDFEITRHRVIKHFAGIPTLNLDRLVIQEGNAARFLLNFKINVGHLKIKHFIPYDKVLDGPEHRREDRFFLDAQHHNRFKDFAYKSNPKMPELSSIRKDEYNKYLTELQKKSLGANVLFPFYSKKRDELYGEPCAEAISIDTLEVTGFFYPGFDGSNRRCKLNKLILSPISITLDTVFTGAVNNLEIQVYEFSGHIEYNDVPLDFTNSNCKVAYVLV